MAKRNQEPIQVKAYLKTADGCETEVEALTPEQRREFATQMKIDYLNALFRGQAVFRRTGGRGAK